MCGCFDLGWFAAHAGLICRITEHQSHSTERRRRGKKVAGARASEASPQPLDYSKRARQPEGATDKRATGFCRPSGPAIFIWRFQGLRARFARLAPPLPLATFLPSLRRAQRVQRKNLRPQRCGSSTPCGLSDALQALPRLCWATIKKHYDCHKFLKRHPFILAGRLLLFFGPPTTL
jgi:hypothetical protein